MSEFLNSLYELPSKKSNTSQSKGNERQAGADQCPNCTVLETVNHEIGDEISFLRSENEKSKTKILKCEKSLEQRQTYTTKRVNQMLKRKNSSINKKSALIRKLKRKIHSLEKKESHVCKSKRVYSKKLRTHDQIIKKLQNTVRQKNACIDDLQIKADSLQTDPSQINTKKDGKTYSDELRETIYDLSTYQISVSNISRVIKSVISHLTDLDIVDLPDQTTCSRIVREMAEISRMHIGEVLQSEKDTTLMYDGISKKKCHYGEVQISTSEQI